MRTAGDNSFTERERERGGGETETDRETVQSDKQAGRQAGCRQTDKNLLDRLHFNQVTRIRLLDIWFPAQKDTMVVGLQLFELLGDDNMEPHCNCVLCPTTIYNERNEDGVEGVDRILHYELSPISVQNR